MIKLFIGGKGSGKTKTLIELANKAGAESKGSVVCIEKGTNLNTDITYKVRLIDAESYAIADATALYGFIAGILSSNSDITDIFVDNSLRIIGGDVAAYDALLDKLAPIVKDVNLVMTASIPVETATAKIKEFV